MLAVLSISLALTAEGCGRNDAQNPAPEPASAAQVLDQVLSGPQRTDEERLRDQYRHPKETLLFFGAEPGMTIVEVWPGGGWYTNILAPFANRDGGTYYAAGLDPSASERAATAVDNFKTKYAANPEVYGDVIVTVLGQEIAPPGSADLILTFRNVHNWLFAGTADANFKAFYAALKPGGVLGVVEHRANPDIAAETSDGYVREATVIALATAAGFELEASSEINANPKDTKDLPFGVWTLPPTRRSSAVAGASDPDFDRAKYDAIGESDRMTLKFRKPRAAEGALLE
jgi:predicted methyltransferase